MEAVILAGGKGTRLRPYTDRMPKALLPLDGMPIMEILVRQLVAVGCTRISLALSWMAADIEAHFKDGRALGAEISHSVSDRLLGTAGPLSLLAPPARPCLVVNADILTSLDFRSLLKAHRDDHLATVVTQRRKVGMRYGVIHTDSDGTAVDIVEKPVATVRINTGIYVLSPRVWGYLTPGRPSEMPELLKRFAADALVGTYELPADARWTDIGVPDDYLDAGKAFERERGTYLPREQVGWSDGSPGATGTVGEVALNET
jgi:NDP-sugar pyrophosphorylase family protein